MKIFTFQQLLSFLFICLFASSAVFADDDDDDDDDDDIGVYGEFLIDVASKSLMRSNVQIRLEPLGYGLMGDQVDPHSGKLSFTTTDIDLPGNSNLPVQITRVAKDAGSSYMQQFYMADWDLQIPSITEDIGQPYYLGDGQKINIPGLGSESDFGNGVDPDLGGTNKIFDEPRWNGQTDINSVTRNHILKKTGKAITTDGTTYTFGHTIRRSAGDKYLPSDFTPTYVGSKVVERTVRVSLATEVTDIHGNWVKYTYTTDGFLTRIHSNDGREITLSYLSADGTKYVSSVTANGRVWNYQYITVADEDRKDQSTRKLLHKVVQPDGKYWEYDLNALVQNEPGYSDTHGVYSNPNYSTITVKHPYGAKASYQLGQVILDSSDRRNPFNTIQVIGTLWHKSKAVFSKTLSVFGNEDLVWEYEYEHHKHSAEYTPVREGGVGGGLSRILTKPDGTRIEYINGDSHGIGLAVSETYAPGTTTVLKRIENEYIFSTHTFGVYNGTASLNDEEEYDESGTAYKSKQTITQNGDTYTTEYTYDLDPYSSTYSYGKPISIKTKSNVSPLRTTLITYTKKANHWRLNLTSKVKVNNIEVASYTYDSLGRVLNELNYGLRKATYGYHTNAAYKGALHTVTDALNRTTYALNYNAGTPRNIKRPDGIQDERIVDDNGWVLSDKNHRGYLTTYQYDNMGRVVVVTPNDNGRYRVAKHISYSFGDKVVQYITDEEEEYSLEKIIYDQLFRPISEQVLDYYGEGTSWKSYVNTKYHANGQVKFKSQKSARLTEVKGIDFTYDGLGRLKTQRENVSPFAKTSYEYLSSNRTRMTDPKGNQTTTWRQGYGSPKGSVVRIEQPMGVNTVMTRDIFGKMLTLKQSGNHNGYSVDQTNNYYYDSRQRLCRQRTPEGGDTVFFYDNAKRITWYAKGQATLAGCSQAVVPNNQRVRPTYDALDREIKLNYPDVTPDVTTSYDANSNVLTKNRGGVNWTYTYNDLDQLTSEALSVDGRNYKTSYTYNFLDHLSTQTTPSNRVINYRTDGLGNTESVKSGSTVYADNISYHPNGALKTMTYGNGYHHDVTLNARQLPYRLYTRKGSTHSLLLYHTYDASANITRILDRSDSAKTYDKYMSYDALNRLTSTNAANAWGNATFKYDPLGNLRQKKLGSRTVNVNYNSLNRVSSVNDAGVSRNYVYDTRGNVRDNGKNGFGYDLSDQPKYITSSDIGMVSSNIYDGNYKRVKSGSFKDGVITVTYYMYGLNGKLLYSDKVIDNVSTKRTDYVRAAGRTIRLENGVPSYTHKDLLGSALSATSSTGVVEWREQYTPFGEKWLNPNANKDNVGFTDHVQDDATGLTYMQARYYDPNIGRFLSIDPVGFKASNPMMFNRYAYVNNNPYKFIDPDGRQLSPDTLGRAEQGNRELRERDPEAAKAAERQALELMGTFAFTVATFGAGTTTVLSAGGVKSALHLLRARGSVALVTVETGLVKAMKDHKAIIAVTFGGPFTIDKSLKAIDSLIERFSGGGDKSEQESTEKPKAEGQENQNELKYRENFEQENDGMDIFGNGGI